MITELTKEQEAKLEEYRQRDRKIGLDTTQMKSIQDKTPDGETIEDMLKQVQIDLLERKDPVIVLFDNPIQCWVSCCWWLLPEFKDKQEVEEIPEDLQNVINIMKEQLGDKMPNKVIDNDTFIKASRNPKPAWMEGSFYAGVFSFYSFLLDELKIEVDDEVRRKHNIWKKTVNTGFIYPLDDFVAVSQKPLEIHVDGDNLHHDGGPAVKYAGSPEFNVWALNGVRVPQYLAETPSSQLDIDWYTRQQNADIKAEFVKKFGIERMLDLGERIDGCENYPDEEYYELSEYELYDMNKLFEGVNYAPHLKMTNLTTGDYHVEAVSPHCRTIKDAMQDRLGRDDITIAGIK